MRAGDLLIGGGILFLVGSAVLYATRPEVTATDDGFGWLVQPVAGGVVGGVRGRL
jgi:hypothetical protein